MSKQELYVGREQTLVKHVILEQYLERFAHIIGSRWDTITYVDGFSGPWNVQSENLEDSSFYIAANQLRLAKDTHTERGRNLNLRCFFLEKDGTAYAKLKQFADETGYATIETRNAAFEDSIDEILEFINQAGSTAFTFLFIDPTGWTGFAMEKITPLLRIASSEVLINFMTGHIRRFIESPDGGTQASFDSLFGPGVPRQRFAGLSGTDLDDELVATYSESVAKAGDFKYVRSAIVLHPEIDRTHFHLIYATRNRKGVEVFKEAEKKAMAVMEAARAGAQQRKRELKNGPEFDFAREALHDPAHYDLLRQRYIGRAQDRLQRSLCELKRVSYDDAWDAALQEPLVWKSDLKKWIEQWKQGGQVRLEGLKPKERTPTEQASHACVDSRCILGQQSMSMDTSQIGNRAWSFAHVLRDDGLSYQAYVEQITFLLFLKMADELTKPPYNRKPIVPAPYDWPNLLKRDGEKLEGHYRKTLEELAKKPGMLGTIYRKAKNEITDPAKLRRLIVDLIDTENWMGLGADVKERSTRNSFSARPRKARRVRDNTSRPDRSFRRLWM